MADISSSKLVRWLRWSKSTRYLGDALVDYSNGKQVDAKAFKRLNSIGAFRDGEVDMQYVAEWEKMDDRKLFLTEKEKRAQELEYIKEYYAQRSK